MTKKADSEFDQKIDQSIAEANQMIANALSEEPKNREIDQKIDEMYESLKTI